MILLDVAMPEMDGFATAHGGTVRASSSAEEGTTFVVEVPRRLAAVARRQSAVG